MKPWPMLRRYRWALLAALPVLAALYWLLAEPMPGEAPNEATSPVLPAAPEPPSSPLRALTPAELAAAGPIADAAPPPAETGASATGGPVDIFAVRTWEPPAPIEPPAEAAPPPPPQAPPLPFRYAGRLEEPGKPIIFFLAQGEQILAVSPGDLINGNYRVGKLEGGQLHFLYRPLKIRQSIPVEGDS